MNRFEFAKLVAEVFNLDSSLWHPVDSSFFPGIAPRPLNTSFLPERMQGELDIEPLSIYEGLMRMRSVDRSASLSPLKKPPSNTE